MVIFKYLMLWKTIHILKALQVTFLQGLVQPEQRFWMPLIVEMHATSFNLTSIQNFWKMVAHATKMEEGSVPKRVPSEIRLLGYAKNKGKHQKIILVLQLFSKR